MLKHRFGNTTREVAAIGQGSWQIEDGNTALAVNSLQAGIDLGLTHIDTAEMYGSGAAERVIGEAIRGRRDGVFLVSKVLPTNASEEGVVQACERSLANLGTEVLDSYLLHWPGRTPLAETVAGFERLLRAGKILSWGVSNFDLALLEQLKALGVLPACNQVLYHLGQRGCEHEVLPWCIAHGVALVAYTPLGQSKAMHDPRQSQGRVLHEVAKRHGASSRQVALAWLLRNEQVFVIPKAAQLAHVIENAGAAKLPLSSDDLAALEKAFPRGAKPRELPTA